MIRKLRTRSTILNEKIGKKWELVVEIPVSVFNGVVDVLDGVNAKGNFFKCGDLLPQPHYLSWNMIDSTVPDFHLSQFFGDLFFK